MNYNSMTDLELLHYLDLYSDDPLIRRIVSVISNTRGALINDLEHAGMDPDTWMFRTDWQSMYPGDYIIHLESQLRHTEEELSGLQYKYDDLEEERDRLRTKSIMEFVQEVNNERLRASLTASEARKETEKVREENAKLREQIDMWGRLNKV